MKRCGKIALCLASGLMLDPVLRAVDLTPTDNPYAQIVARNVFSLNPPPPPPETTPVLEPAVKITPSGIMSVFGQLQALFKTSGGGKPGEQFYNLAEGQAEDEIEVVKIDEKAGIITFNNHGQEQKLPLVSTSANNNAAPAVPGQTAAISFNPVASFPPTAQGGGIRGGVGPATFIPPVTGVANNAGTPNSNPGMATFGGVQSGAGNSASLGFKAATYGNNTTPQTKNTVDPDVQKVLVVAQHLKAQLDGDPMAKIFPPTEMDEEAGIPSNVAPTTNQIPIK